MVDDPENNNSDEYKPHDKIEKHDPVEDESVILTPTPSDGTMLDVKAEEYKKKSLIHPALLPDWDDLSRDEQSDKLLKWTILTRKK